MIETKTAHVGLRVTIRRRELYRRLAEAEGRRLSEWLRLLADHAVQAAMDGEAARHGTGQ